VLPSALVGYAIIQDNFLELQVRRNLIYSLVAGFALLLYLNVILKLSGYLERREILPSAVTEGVMIFLLVVLLEPVKKQINNLLHTAFVSEFERVQKLSDEIQEQAKRTGDLELLKAYVEDRVARGLGLEKVTLQLGGVFTPGPSQPRKVRVFPIRRGEEALGSLVVTPVTADLSGDLQGALELLAEQLAAAIELCRLIADKVQLERALAEKAKMAFLGEMATRIAHNVKNPLSSMKTLVQLLEEDPSLPERARRDCGMVIEQIDRLNTNISQVLRYAKPARDTDRAVDLTALVASVVNVLRAEAGSRQISLELESTDGPCAVQGGKKRPVISSRTSW
jgi:signal transduction histidine kinase